MKIHSLVNIKQHQNSPIGVFDSGLGGLTVLKSLENMLPNESFIYFGDTAHVPYGTKSAEAVIKYSQNILDYFLEHNTKAVVIACNTASAVAYHVLQKNYSIPLFDVVSPSVEYACQESITKNIGVIGTTSTVSSKAYSRQFAEKNIHFAIHEISCPLFVPVIEEGWADTSVAREIASIYLQDFQENNIDTLILGCTHYPIMANTIQSVLSSHVQLVFSGETVGQKLSRYLNENNLINTSSSGGHINFYVSDFPQKFDALGSRFFGRKLIDVTHISFV